MPRNRHGAHRYKGHHRGRCGGSFGRGGGPPWGRRSHWRRRGLRRKLTVAFAAVALAAVALTVWLTLGAVFSAQSELFELAAQDPGAGPPALEEEHGPPWWGPFGRDGAFLRGSPEATAAGRALASVSRTAFLAALLAFLLAGVAAGFVTRLFTRPLVALTSAAERLGEGERGIRVPVPGGDDELARLAEAFNELVARLERQETWRRDMVADVAHDLRTPLAVMRSEIEALQDGVRPVSAESLQMLHAEVMLLARLVSDLRTLSLTESAAIELDTAEVPLREFLTGIAEFFAARARAAGTTVEVAHVRPEDATARFDRQRMQRVLVNLVENSLTHGAGGAVQLSAERSPSQAVLRVRDHGPGLAEAALERVFERFYRAEESRTRRDADSGGSGLGLPIAKALVEAHGGTISAANHPDGGAVLEIRLPS